MLRDRADRPHTAIDRTIVRAAIPALGTLAIEPLYVVVDTAIVGHLGTSALGGLAIAAQVLLFVTGCCNFLAYATTQRVAHHRGAGRPDDAARVGVQALWLSVLIGVPLAVAMAVFAEPVARALGGDGATLEAATSYLRISAFALPAILVAFVGHGVLRAALELRRVLVIVAAASLANVVLEVVAVYGLDLGIEGSAWSTVVVQVVAAFAYLGAIRPHLAPARSHRIVVAELLALLRVGGLLVVRVIALYATFTIATALAARTDEPTLAAHHIVSTMYLLLALVLDAPAIPAQSLVAEAIGAADEERARLSGNRVRALSLRSGVVLALALAALSPVLPRVFTTDPAVIDRAAAGLVVLAIALLPGAVAFGLDGVLIGAAEYRFLSVLMIVSFAVFALAIVVLTRPAGAGIVTIWLAVATWMGARAVGCAWRWNVLRGGRLLVR